MIALRVRRRYSRLVQNDCGEPALAARTFVADAIGRLVVPLCYPLGTAGTAKRVRD